MSLEFVPLQKDYIPDLAQICHNAFAELHRHHAVPQDIPNLETALWIMKHIAQRPDYTGVVAMLDGQIAGSNFLLHSDEVAGIGPISVDIAAQTQGIGRGLMQWIIAEGQRLNIRQMRLFQEAINPVSLSLYSSLGFVWRGSAALMRVYPAMTDDPLTRPLTMNDLDAVKSLSLQSYGFSRAGDAKQLLLAGLPGFIRERNGQAVGYFLPSLFGHGGAIIEDDLLALISHAARHIAPEIALFLCPLQIPHLFHLALAQHHRTIKLFSYMSFGEFTEPKGFYLPSISC